MTLKERWHKVGETRQAIREVEIARLKKEYEAREEDINRQAEKLADELHISIETAKRYIKAKKVNELRTAKRQQFKKKAVKLGRAIQERAAAAQATQAGRNEFDEMAAFFGTGSKPRKRKKRKTIKTKNSTKSKSKRGKKRGSTKKPREIRILLE